MYCRFSAALVHVTADAQEWREFLPPGIYEASADATSSPLIDKCRRRVSSREHVCHLHLCSRRRNRSARSSSAAASVPPPLSPLLVRGCARVTGASVLRSERDASGHADAGNERNIMQLLLASARELAVLISNATDACWLRQRLVRIRALASRCQSSYASNTGHERSADHEMIAETVSARSRARATHVYRPSESQCARVFPLQLT